MCLGPANAQSTSPIKGTNTITTIHTPLVLDFPSLLRRRLIAHNSISTSAAASTNHVVSIGMRDLLIVLRLGGYSPAGFIKFVRTQAKDVGIKAVLMDAVYEGKSMLGMVERVRRGEFPEGSRVLYAPLGGVPALNAYSFRFRNG
jgi:hypothetical protein